MKIIFWQNIISPHQISLLSELNKKCEILLIYQKQTEEYREKMGWEKESPKSFNILSCAEFNELSLFERNKILDSSFHIFSGINAYKELKPHFRYLYKKKPESLYIYMEKPDSKIFSNLVSLFRFIKYCFYSFKFKKIKKIITPGGKDYFTKAFWSANVVADFAYYGPKTLADKNLKLHDKDIVKLLYVGELSNRKNLYMFLQTLLQSKNRNWQLEIIGEGEEEDALRKLCKANYSSSKNIKFLKYLRNETVLKKMKMVDYVVLPSKHDGWGYVVNEAFSVGAGVIASKNCGVSSLSNFCENFHTFQSKSDLTKILANLCASGPLKGKQKKKNLEFYNNFLRPAEGVKKLMNIL